MKKKKKKSKFSDRLTPYILTPEKEIVKGFNCLIYGDQGTGKTHFVATAQDHEEMADLLFLSIEGGTKTISGRRDIRTIDIEDFSHLEDVFWGLVGKSKEYKTIRTVGIDSVTELQTLNIEEISSKNKSKGERVDLQDYGKSTKQLKRIFRFFKDLQLNVIMTALPKTIESQSDEYDTETIPDLTNKLSNALMGYMDFLWYLKAKESNKFNKKGDKIINRFLLTQAHGGYRAKTRGLDFSSAIGAKIKNPTLPEIYDIYKNSGKRK